MCLGEEECKERIVCMYEGKKTAMNKKNGKVAAFKYQRKGTQRTCSGLVRPFLGALN
jgi:hypothetical protein